MKTLLVPKSNEVMNRLPSSGLTTNAGVQANVHASHIFRCCVFCIGLKEAVCMHIGLPSWRQEPQVITGGSVNKS